MTKKLPLCTVAAMLLCVTSRLLAHHGTSVTYDTSKEITVSGTVTEFGFSFPHVHIYFDVQDASGKVAKWGTELAPSPTMLRRLDIGWARESIKPGDSVTVTCNPHRVPGATACLTHKLVVNGKLLPLNAAQVNEQKGTPNP